MSDGRFSDYRTPQTPRWPASNRSAAHLAAGFSLIVIVVNIALVLWLVLILALEPNLYVYMPRGNLAMIVCSLVSILLLRRITGCGPLDAYFIAGIVAPFIAGLIAFSGSGSTPDIKTHSTIRFPSSFPL